MLSHGTFSIKAFPRYSLAAGSELTKFNNKLNTMTLGDL